VGIGVYQNRKKINFWFNLQESFGEYTQGMCWDFDVLTESVMPGLAVIAWLMLCLLTTKIWKGY
jgi:hypothetical protein